MLIFLFSCKKPLMPILPILGVCQNPDWEEVSVNPVGPGCAM